MKQRIKRLEQKVSEWRRGTRVKIMILSESTRRLLGKQRRGKDEFRFSFFPPFPSFLSLPLRGKFERAESTKGAENKGTTIVEGTKTSSLKFQRPAWSREKIKKRRRRHFELKEEKRRERRDAANYLARNVYISAETFRLSDFSNNWIAFLFVRLDTPPVVVALVYRLFVFQPSG